MDLRSISEQAEAYFSMSVEDQKKLYKERYEFIKTLDTPESIISYDLGEAYDRVLLRDEVTALWDNYFSELEELKLHNDLHIYTHTPFCKSKCFYCHCESVPIQPDDNLEAYVDHVLDEANSIGKLTRGYPVTSVYFGGGTTTIYDSELFDRLIGGVID